MTIVKKKITRVQLNANFYDTLDDEISEIKKTSSLINNKLLEIKNRLSLIDKDYFDKILNDIEQTIGIQSLYIDTTLTDEEKFLALKNTIQTYLDQIGSIVDQNLELIDNFEDVFSIEDNQLASNIQLKLDDLLNKMTSFKSLDQLNEKMLEKFDAYYPGISKNLLIIDDKFKTEKDGGIEYAERIVNLKSNSKNIVKDIKKSLNNYKIRTIGYLVGSIILVIAIILAIVIPIVLK